MSREKNAPPSSSAGWGKSKSTKPAASKQTAKAPSKSAGKPAAKALAPSKAMDNRSKEAQQKGKNIPVTIKTHHDKKGGHPHIIMGDIDERHVSVGMSTKSKKGKNNTNYAMEKSPFDDGKQSYMRRQGTVAPRTEYSGKRMGTLTPKDYERAKEYGDKAKEKYINEKKSKKK